MLTWLKAKAKADSHVSHALSLLICMPLTLYLSSLSSSEAWDVAAPASLLPRMHHEHAPPGTIKLIDATRLVDGFYIVILMLELRSPRASEVGWPERSVSYRSCETGVLTSYQPS